MTKDRELIVYIPEFFLNGFHHSCLIFHSFTFNRTNFNFRLLDSFYKRFVGFMK